MEEDGPAAQKRVLRKAARARRRELLSADPGLHAAVARAFLAAIPLRPGAVIGAYFALPGELDPAPLLADLARRGHPLALPAVVKRGQPLAFRAWAPGDALVKSGFSVMEPLNTAPERIPDLLVVPLLRWDRRGHRLGYGGGYYDRSLAALPHAATVGYSLDGLEIDRLPVEPWDRPLGALVTESGSVELTPDP
mgnify:CR=1 FL=1